MLPLETIVSDVHVKLDVRKQKLIIVDPVHHTDAVIVKEYDLKTMDTALEFFEYVDAMRDTGRFLSVTVI